MTCTFFGHRDCDENIYENLKKAIIELIQNEGVTQFYVGNNGSFDRLVIRVLKDCKSCFSVIDYCVVLAYMPKNEIFDYPTVFPYELSMVPKCYAISYRNKYMLEKSDFVIAFITHTFGGAYNSIVKSQKMNKKVIKIYTKHKAVHHMVHRHFSILNFYCRRPMVAPTLL